MSAEVLSLGVQPIRPDAPGGDSCRETAEFEALQVEIRKLEHPDQPAVNWDGVAKSAALLLGQRGKDLLVASYLAVALFERDGFPGLEAGLTVMRDLATNFWESLFPEVKRVRGRVAALEWLAERGALRARRQPAPQGDVRAAEACVKLAAELDDLAAPRLDAPPLLADFRRALDEAASELASPAPVAAAPAATPVAAAAPSPAAPAAVTTPETLEAALAEARRLLRSAGEYLRGGEPTSPLAYRLPRFALWMPLKQLPPSVAGKTQIPAPQPPDIGSRLQGMLAGGQYAGVLQETEGRIGASIFWLDLHRFAWSALQGLGPEYAAAADAVREETAALLRRFPELPELRFANDQGLADAETRAWVQQKVLSQPGAEAPAPAPAAAASAAGQELEAARAEARKLLQKRRIAEAVGLLEKGALRAANLSERVAWRLEVARICQEAGLGDTALARLESLDQEMSRSTIEDWDPALCAEVLKQLLVCRQKVLSSQKAGPEDLQRSRELMGRLCRVDVVAAVEFNGRK